MKGEMIILGTAPDGSVTMENRQYTAPIPTGDINKAVGGYIEIVPYFLTLSIGGETRPCVVFCNEDGKRLRLPRNHAADGLWDLALEGTPNKRIRDSVELDYLVGSVAIILGDDEFMESL